MTQNASAHKVFCFWGAWSWPRICAPRPSRSGIHYTHRYAFVLLLALVLVTGCVPAALVGQSQRPPQSDLHMITMASLLDASPQPTSIAVSVPTAWPSALGATVGQQPGTSTLTRCYQQRCVSDRIAWRYEPLPDGRPLSALVNGSGDQRFTCSVFARHVRCVPE